MRGSKYSTRDKLLWSVHLVLSTAPVPFAARPRFAAPELGSGTPLELGSARHRYQWYQKEW